MTDRECVDTIRKWFSADKRTYEWTQAMRRVLALAEAALEVGKKLREAMDDNGRLMDALRESRMDKDALWAIIHHIQQSWHTEHTLDDECVQLLANVCGPYEEQS